MWVRNNKRVTAQYYIRSDIRSNITNIKGVSDKIDGIVSAVDSILGDSYGMGNPIIDDCRAAVDQLKAASEKLERCAFAVDNLKTEERIDDDQYK